MDVRQCQRAFLKHALRLNKLPDAGDGATAAGSKAVAKPWAVEWKILVMDQFARSVLCHLLPVSELRRLGATLHLSLEAHREPIAGVPAVYITEPGTAAFKAIAADCGKGLYKGAYVNLTREPTAEELDAFARACVDADGAGLVDVVAWQPLSFRCPGPRLLSLGRPDALVTLMGAGMGSDALIESEVQSIVAGLADAFTALGQVPMVAFPGRGHGPSQVVGRLLAERLGDPGFASLQRQLRAVRAAEVPGGSAAGQRPLLVLLDRTLDLAAGLSHPSTYGALVAETMETSNDGTRVRIPPAAGGEGVTVMDLDPESDEFWSRAAALPFGEAVEMQAKEIKEAKAEEDRLRAATSSTASGAGGSGLGDAVQALPALLERKGRLMTHTKLMTAVLGEVARRGLSDLHSIETSSMDRGTVLSVLRGERPAGGGEADASADGAAGGIGSLHDRARLACMFLVSDKASKSSSSSSSGSSSSAGGESTGEDSDVEELCRAMLRGATSLPAPPAHQGQGGSGKGGGIGGHGSTGASLSAFGASLGSFMQGDESSSSSSSSSSSEEAVPVASAAAVETARRLCRAVRWVAKHRRESALLHASEGSGTGHVSAPSSGTAAAIGTSLVAALAGATKSIARRGGEALSRLVGSDAALPSTQFVAAAAGDKAKGALQPSGPGSSIGYVDPRSSATSGTTKAPGDVPGSPYSSVFVFVLGGVTHAEATNLEDWARNERRGVSLSSSRGATRAVAVGGTDILSGKTLVEQLASLG